MSAAGLLAELHATDTRMRALLDGLDDAQLTVPYDRGINPPVWEVGHAAFFTEYFLLRELGHPAPRMPGYDEIWDSFEIAHEIRWRDGVVPDKATTLDYYRRVRDEVRARLEAGDPSPRERYLTRYAIHHQNMHVESMIWCRQTLGYPPPPFARDEPAAGGLVDGDASFDGGAYPIGLGADAPFAFDNEKPGFDRELAPFRIARAPVTNREFAAFVENGGYARTDLWSFGGRSWLEKQPAEHPLYWRRNADGAWETRRFDRWLPLPLDAAVVHVNFWEADAYCRWAGRRLPTEFEWEAAARGRDGRAFPWGDAMDPARVDMDGRHAAPPGVGALPAGATPEGCVQMIGGAWEWTSSQFLPYDGFAVDMYPFMSTLQFGDHKTTKGGSLATSSCLIRNTYRQALFPARRDAFTGFRTCAR